MNAQDKGGLIPLHNAASYGVNVLDFHMIYFPKKKKFFDSIMSQYSRKLLLSSCNIIFFAKK